MRAVLSVPPPAAHGQIMVMGRLGQAPCARSTCGKPSVAAAPAAAPPIRTLLRDVPCCIVSSPHVLVRFELMIAKTVTGATASCAGLSRAGLLGSYDDFGVRLPLALPRSLQ